MIQLGASQLTFFFLVLLGIIIKIFTMNCTGRKQEKREKLQNTKHSHLDMKKWHLPNEIRGLPTKISRVNRPKVLHQI